MGVLAQAENDMVKRALRKARARQLSFAAPALDEKRNACRFGKNVSDRSDEVSLLFGAHELSARFHAQERLRMLRVGNAESRAPLF